MEKDRRKTFVRFVIHKGEVLAVFMRHDAGKRWNKDYWLRACYAHVGQHGECCDGTEQRKRATPEQYKALHKEMEGLGYNLSVM